ncbi:hypothetical protein BG261_02840 [Floricoccus tropicus]|uniref:tRNA nuclease CdiA C-terminal domain-containing protein n=1 Tax=Floricoccus tropicus TaxID=1859473 RepID=A0A1E8GMS1_9LACT|nr:hypothetical protein [Floricoccus tropicus]OFI49532.1 hypothetical protein BG261_02840 [Floricoccus tropicus]
MHDDIVPELLEAISSSFDNKSEKSKKIEKLLRLLQDGDADYLSVNEYAIEIGEILSSVFRENITADILPDGKMYFNIADRVLNKTLKNNYDLVSKYAEEVQNLLNERSGIGIAAQIPDINQNRINGLINRISSEDDFNKIEWILKDPIVNFTQSIVDDSIKKNVEFHFKSGLSPTIKRTVSGKACAWCRSLAGVFLYGTEPPDFYKRHQNCRCLVEYNPRKGKRVQNSHTKQWHDSDELTRRKTLNLYDSKVDKSYISLKDEWLKNFNSKNIKVSELTRWEHQGIVYLVDGKKVVLDYSGKEEEVASWIAEKFGMHVQFVPRVNYPSGMKTPDYLVNGIAYDLKEITGNGKNVIDGNMKKAKVQSENIIIDITKSKLTDNDVKNQLEKIYRSGRRGLNIVVIKRGNTLIDVLKKES